MPPPAPTLPTSGAPPRDPYLGRYYTSQAALGDAARPYTIDATPSHLDPNRPYDSSADNSASQQMLVDMQRNARNPGTWASMGIGPDAVQAVRSYNSWKQARSVAGFNASTAANRARAAARAAPTDDLSRLDPESRTAREAFRRRNAGQPMTAEEVRASQQAERQDAQRGGYNKNIDAYFANPARLQWQQGIVQDRLNSDLGGITDSFGKAQVSGAQRTASQGLIGGSVDSERRADNEHTRDSAALSAGAAADADLSGFRARDSRSRTQLHGLVDSGSISEDRSFGQALQGLNDQTNAEGQQYAIGQQQRDLTQFGSNGQSQIIGGALGNFGNQIRTNPYLASSSRAWLGWDPTASPSSVSTGGF